jgi:hypothetical protein
VEYPRSAYHFNDHGGRGKLILVVDAGVLVYLEIIAAIWAMIQWQLHADWRSGQLCSPSDAEAVGTEVGKHLERQ